MLLRKLVMALAAVAVGSSAQAAFITGSSGFSFDNAVGINSSNLSGATQFTLSPSAGASTQLTSNTPNPVTGGDFITQLPGNVAGTISPTTITLSNTSATAAVTNTPIVISFGSGRTLTLTSGSVFSRGSAAESASVALSFSGTINFAGFDPTPGAFTLQFNQTGSGAVSGAGTFAALAPVAPIPAPPTVFALLSALPALAVLRRVRRLAA